MLQRDAFALAQEILDDYDDVEVVAVGRFVAFEDIAPSVPWAISVLIAGDDRPTVIRDRAEIEQHRRPSHAPVVQQELFS